MEDPEWLLDDTPAPTAPHQPKQPHAPPPGAAGLRSPRRNFAEIDDELEANGLGFLSSRENKPPPPPLSKPTSASSSAPEKGLGLVYVKETKKGALIVDVDTCGDPLRDGITNTDAPSTKPTTNAPVHFIKRMQEAEQKKQEKLQAMKESITSQNHEDEEGDKKKMNSSCSVRSRGDEGKPPKTKKPPSRGSDDDTAPLPVPLSTKPPTTAASSIASIDTALMSGGIEMQEVDLSVVPPLSEGDAQMLAPMIQLFTEPVIAKLRSNRFQHRVEAIQIIRDRVIADRHEEEEEELDALGDTTTDAASDHAPSKTPSEVSSMGDSLCPASGTRLRTFFEVMQMGLKDSLFHVVVATCCAIDSVIQVYSVISSIVVRGEIRSVTLGLISRLKDSNTKVRDAVTSCLINLSYHTSVGPLMILSLIARGSEAKAAGTPISNLRSAPTTPNGPEDWRVTIAKIELAQAILQRRKECVERCCDDALLIATAGLCSTNERARKRAVPYFGFLHGILGKGVEPALQTVNTATIKVLKKELGFSEDSTFGSADKLVSTATFVADQETREEDEDLAALEADKEKEKTTPKQDAVIKQLKEAFPTCRSIACLCSSRWKLRERLVLRLETLLGDIVEEERRSNQEDDEEKKKKEAEQWSKGLQLHAVCAAVACASEDTVPAVASAGLGLLASIIEWGEVSKHAAEALKEDLGTIVPVIVPLTASTATADVATGLLTRLARIKECGGIHGVLSLILRLESPNNDAAAERKEVGKMSIKAICPRLDTAAALLDTVTEDKNVSLSLILRFALAAFQHAQVKVRTCSANVVVSLYKRVGDQVQPYLQNLKGTQLTDLQSRMAKITKREKLQAGGQVKQRLAVFSNPLLASAATPPKVPKPKSRRVPPTKLDAPGANNSDNKEDDLHLLPGIKSPCPQSQGASRKGNLVFS